MKTYKEISADKKGTLELKGLIEIYEEIAAAKMQQIRSAILDSREYFDGLAKMSDEVGSDLDVGPDHKKRHAVVFLSADAGLFGDIIDKILVDFLSFVEKNKADVFIAGKLGVELMHSYAPRIKYQYFELSDDKINMEEFGEVVKKLLEYQKISVFYGKFVSIVIQNSSVSTMSGKSLEEFEKSEDEKEKEIKQRHYIYEPSLEAISEKFGNEILTSVFEQTVRESQLAKYASRLMHLDFALENVDERLKTIHSDRRRIKKRINGKKQTERVARLISVGKF